MTVESAVFPQLQFQVPLAGRLFMYFHHIFMVCCGISGFIFGAPVSVLRAAPSGLAATLLWSVLFFGAGMLGLVARFKGRYAAEGVAVAACGLGVLIWAIAALMPLWVVGDPRTPSFQTVFRFSATACLSAAAAIIEIAWERRGAEVGRITDERVADYARQMRLHPRGDDRFEGD